MIAKKLSNLWLLAIGMVATTACVRSEAPNAEADIVSASLDGGLLIREPVITNNEVQFYVNGWNDKTHLSPTFTITPGAILEPESGTERDFSQPQTYTVTSEDGKWKKAYKVSFLSTEPLDTYNFENMRFYEYKDEWDPDAPAQKRFHILYDIGADGQEITWASGNSGYMFSNPQAKPEEYPTSQAENGFSGKCAKLVTVSTGALGVMFGAPIAAGNLFLGTFELNFMDKAKSTRFGVPFNRIPLALKGYYNYTPGAQTTDKANKPVEVQDRCDIYAVLYETDSETPYLDGSNSLTSPNIVRMARLENPATDGQWHEFTIEFKDMEGKKVDEEKLQKGAYNIAIIMTSSVDGANFTGAVGSTLYVDEINLYYQ